MPIPCLIVAGCAAAAAVTGSSCCNEDANAAPPPNNAGPVTHVMQYTVVQQPARVVYVQPVFYGHPYPQQQRAHQYPPAPPPQQWAPQYLMNNRPPAMNPYRGEDAIEMTPVRQRVAAPPPTYAQAMNQQSATKPSYRR